MKLLASIITIAILFTTVGASRSEAVSTPSFGSCLTPAGTVKASYPTGNHGIVGDSSIHSGSDTVYTLSNDTLMQCFCEENGSGIQTNWLRISELTEDEIKVLENQGWIFVPSGSAWGLDDASYIAQNISYSCKSTTTNTGGPGDGLSDGRSDGRSDGLGGVSIIETAKGNALNLATTGNIIFMLTVLSLGTILTGLGFLLKKKA